jgi:hypothetical protein
MSTVKEGQRVNIKAKNLAGFVRFVGVVKFATGKWIGIELDTSQGTLPLSLSLSLSLLSLERSLLISKRTLLSVLLFKKCLFCAIRFVMDAVLNLIGL